MCRVSACSCNDVLIQYRIVERGICVFFLSIRLQPRSTQGSSSAASDVYKRQLRWHPAIERVWYPKWEFRDAYEAVRKPQGGWGALVTFLPRHAETTAPRIYDRLEVCKGPSLGTVFTLACPFTLLAPYIEPDWAGSCGLTGRLIRRSVGVEDPDDLRQLLQREQAGLE